MSSSIFNENIQNRVINPRSGFSQFVDLSNNQTIYGIKTFVDNIYLNNNLISTGNISTTGTISGTFINNNQFVDLSSNQSIAGIKRFLNNLITNSDVNFNTTANIGRIIFNPNEPGGSGSQIVSIYTTDEIDGQAWFFDSVGNLYYLGNGISPIKIMLSGGTGDITILGNFNGFSDIICHNNLTSDIINSYSGGNITFNNGIALGSNTINSGNIISNGTISAVDISSTGIIFANDVNLKQTGYLNVNNITSSVASGSYQTKIALSNEFIDINNSSLDIVATYVGFASPIQTLSTASKYMFIKPLSTGNFEMLMNNISNKILSSDWATTKISSQYIWNLNNISNQNAIILDSLATSGNRLQIYGTPSGTKYLYYNISDELGVIEGSTSQWKITSAGAISCSELNASSGIIQTTGAISGGAITCSALNASSGTIQTTGAISGASITGTTSLITNLINASTGTVKNSIQMDNRFIDIGTGSVDIKSTYVGFPHLSQTLTTASKYMYIKPGSDGNFEIKINGISNVVLGTDWSALATATQFNTTWQNTAGVLMGFINPNPPAGVSPTMRIMGTSNQYIYYNTSNNFGNYNSTTSTTNWEITSGGNFTTNGILSLKNGIYIPILLDPTTAAGNRLQIYSGASGTRYLFFNTSSTLALFNTATSANVWSINGAGDINTTGSILTNTINQVSGTTISTNAIWNFKNGIYIPILLDPTTSSGNRLQIYGVAGGTKYLFFNTSNNIGVFNTATGANVWSIDGTTGNINTIGTLTYSSLAVTSLTTNLINASTGTNKIQMDNRFFNTGVGSIDLKSTYIGFPQLSQTLDINSKYMAIVPQTDGNFNMSINNIASRVLISNWSSLILSSEFNWRFLKSAGINRILMFNTSTSGDIMQICRTGDNAYTDGYWYFNNTGNFGYSTAGGAVFEVSNTGAITTNSTILSQGGIFSNGAQNNFNSSGVRAIYVPNGTIETYRLLVNESGNSAISVPNGGVTAYRLIANNYIQCVGQYMYNEHSTVGGVCGFWSNRTGAGGGLAGNNNGWVAMGGMECNFGTAIGYPAYNYNNTQRTFMWMLETTNNSGKALGLAINMIQSPNSYINATNQGTGFALLGYFNAAYRGAAAYSFTGEHSSMVCDEEYNDLMNYNTDDFIGMIVCSSGKIYNLPYTPDGDTYSKQVDNIKPIDAQPMTRLSKKYKDKSVLGVISHIEKVGKERNDINATCWTGTLRLDKDGRRRIRVACIGEGGIWITNEYGNIENGDYITTSAIAGYSTKQDDDIMHNYTIAKATMDCNFDIEKPDDYKTKYLGDGVYASYISCTFHSG